MTLGTAARVTAGELDGRGDAFPKAESDRRRMIARHVHRGERELRSSTLRGGRPGLERPIDLGPPNPRINQIGRPFLAKSDYRTLSTNSHVALRQSRVRHFPAPRVGRCIPDSHGLNTSREPSARNIVGLGEAKARRSHRRGRYHDANHDRRRRDQRRGNLPQPGHRRVFRRHRLPSGRRATCRRF